MLPVMSFRSLSACLVVAELAAAAQTATGAGRNGPDDFAALCADRIAIERVYYRHRLGAKPPFEEVMPSNLVQRLVRDDLHKETVLWRAYKVRVTSAQVEAEVHRIDTTTRAPGVLAELKTAVGQDPARFARTVAQPIVVERLLRERFDHDDQLHRSLRLEADVIRTNLLVAHNQGVPLAQRRDRLERAEPGHFSEWVWQLKLWPATDQPPAAPAVPARPSPLKMRSSAYSIDGTVQVAQGLSSPERTGHKPQSHLEDLPADLEQVVQAQLRQPGDVSAVIEAPRGFLVYLCLDRTPDVLKVASVMLPKQSYESWLASFPVELAP